MDVYFLIKHKLYDTHYMAGKHHLFLHIRDAAKYNITYWYMCDLSVHALYHFNFKTWLNQMISIIICHPFRKYLHSELVNSSFLFWRWIRFVCFQVFDLLRRYARLPHSRSLWTGKNWWNSARKVSRKPHDIKRQRIWTKETRNFVRTV